jgi:hypothetical protein
VVSVFHSKSFISFALYHFRFRFFDNTSDLFLQIFFRLVCLKTTSQCSQNPNFFTPNVLWLSKGRSLQNKRNILSSWVLKYGSESRDAKIASGDWSKSTFDFYFPNDCTTYNPIFSCRSLFELQAAFESFKCIPERYLRPISSSNWLTIELFRYLWSRSLNKKISHLSN